MDLKYVHFSQTNVKLHINITPLSFHTRNLDVFVILYCPPLIHSYVISKHVLPSLGNPSAQLGYKVDKSQIGMSRCIVEPERALQAIMNI